MKLFAWQPDGHGEDSFFVMAENEAAAREAVEAFIRQPRSARDYVAASGWGTDYYKLTVADEGQVLTNLNE